MPRPVLILGWVRSSAIYHTSETGNEWFPYYELDLPLI